MSKFFINRPIVAIVISILTVVLGVISALRLPVAQFPDITPPEVKIQATFTGADADTLAQSVATPIEEQISGVDNMNYMWSVNATSNGQTTMTVDFAVGTDPNTDLILTQERETEAAPQLPAQVAQYGVTVQKSTHNPLMLIALYSPHGTHEAQFLANYAYINLDDPITRVSGVANVSIFGSGQYAMRIWLDPEKLARLGITASDAINAVESQNTVNPAGQIGGEPVPPGQEYTYPVLAQGRLVTAEQFGNIIVRENPNGGTVRLRDVAKIELGSQYYTERGRLNGNPSAVIAVFPLPGANAIDTANRVKALLAQWKPRFPQDMSYAISLDTTTAVTEGIREIGLTLVLAIGLVVLVVYVFLQGWRATLIPLLAVPVSLIGTFILFPVFGYSINTLTMFGLVLAIGLVVDDAIVVVEVVERHIEEGLAPKAAALKAMEEISGPVIGIALVLSSVFIPTIFVPGITGQLYKQFALTIAVSVIISAFNALSLSPALAALLLRPQKSRGPLGWFFDRFDRGFNWGRERYIRISALLIRRSVVAMVLLGLCVLGAFFFWERMPSGFLPIEDEGFVFVNMQLPQDSSLQETSADARVVEHILTQTPGIQYVTSVVGFSLLSYVQTTYNAFFFVVEKPWSQRTKPDEQYEAIVHHLNEVLPRLPQGTVFAFSPPAIPGVGTSGGVTMVLEDRSGQGIPWLAANADKYMAAARKRPEIASISTSFNPAVPQDFINVDRMKALKLGIPIADIYQTIQTLMGGYFVNYFNRFGRQWQVYVEGAGPYRTNTRDLGQYYVRNNLGQMVPLSALAQFEPRYGPEFIMHYNEYSAAELNVTAAPGYSSMQAMDALEQVFRETMPQGMGYDWMDMSFQEQKAERGVSPMTIFAMSFLFVFLILAALYESWSLPFSVLLSTPIAVLGAFGMLYLRRVVDLAIMPAYKVELQNDVYAQIGLVMLIGLAAKNAILIVAFAKGQYDKGRPLMDAALEGARLRLRPILMTSFAFILGVAPLWVASGAGAVSRQIMGTTVIGGMIGASIIGIFFVPVIFCVVETIAGARRAHPLPSNDSPGGGA
ncbi:MAG: multidrug efflux RND transporter permease subunit [Acidobacteriaceae bacterium]